MVDGVWAKQPYAWDQHLKAANVVIVLCGSQVNTMETLMQRQSPLFGRFTGQWRLQSLPFAALREFFPTWSTEERAALYAIIGVSRPILNGLILCVGLWCQWR